MAHTIVLVDDDRSFHILLDRLIGKEFNILHAYNAQDAIDLVSEEPVHLIVSDFQMPEVNGLQLLNSLSHDSGKRQIPILIVTGYESDEIEKKAYDLGAADFISKSEIAGDRSLLLERIRLKIVSEVKITELDQTLSRRKKLTVKQVLQAALKREYDQVAQSIVQALHTHFNAGHVSLWKQNEPAPTLEAETDLPNGIGLSEAADINRDHGFQEAFDERRAFLSNHSYDSESEGLASFCQSHDLSARLVVPLFEVDEKQLIIENLQIPSTAPVYGYIMLLRSELFSTKEHELLSSLCTRLGAILWRLNQTVNSD